MGNLFSSPPTPQAQTRQTVKQWGGKHQHANLNKEDEQEKKGCRLLKRPWRNIRQGEWDEEFCGLLIRDINGTNKLSVDKKTVRILCIGPTGAGKSSFINSVVGIDKGRPSNQEIMGEYADSMTEILSEIIPKRNLISFRMFDTTGIEGVKGEGIHETDVGFILTGNMNPNYQFNNKKPILTTDQTYFKTNPSLEDQVHCVVLVIDATTLSNIGEDMEWKIQDFQTMIKRQGIGVMLLLTKIDEVCPHENLEKVFYCSEIAKVITDAHAKFGIPQMNIYPVKNYCKEEELCPKMNALILMAVRKMVRMAEDRLDHIEDQGI